MAKGTGKAGRRAGLTLIELLVVISVIGVLIGLLLPAVQASREAARRTMCQANLRDQGIAIHAFEHAKGTLPAFYNGGFLDRPRTAIDEFHFHSWRSALLPYLEQSNVLASLNFELSSTVAANQTGVNVRLSVFVCPSSANPTRTVPDIQEWNEAFMRIPMSVVGTAARNDYEAVGGVRVAVPNTTSIDLSVIRFGAWGEPTHYDTSNGTARDRTIRLADVTDGLSNTIFVGERAGRPDFYKKWGPMLPHPNAYGDHHQAAWAISTHFVWTVFEKDQRVNQYNDTGFYSFHPGGAHGLMGDGAVRFLKESTDPAILKALATRAGG